MKLLILYVIALFQTSGRFRRAVTALPERLWPNATIPYVMGKNVTGLEYMNTLYYISNKTIRYLLKYLPDPKFACLQILKILINQNKGSQSNSFYIFGLKPSFDSTQRPSVLLMIHTKTLI